MEAIIRQLKIADITGDHSRILDYTLGQLDQLYPVTENGMTFFINAYGNIYFYFGDNGIVFCDRSIYSLLSFYDLEYNYNRHERGKLNKHLIIIIKMVMDMYFKRDLNINILPLPII